jgi:hypothetical protein
MVGANFVIPAKSGLRLGNKHCRIAVWLVGAFPCVLQGAVNLVSERKRFACRGKFRKQRSNGVDRGVDHLVLIGAKRDVMAWLPGA